jgi:hypothetical protein
MTSQPAATDPQSLATQPAADAQYYRGILHGLIDIGAELARVVLSQAKAATTQTEPNPAPAQDVAPGFARARDPDPAVAFERISRAIRRTILLAQKIAQPVAQANAHPVQHRAAARRRIIRDVEDAIQRESRGVEAEFLHAELVDRLDGPDLDDDIENRPIADIIRDICRDLGIEALPGTHPWKRRAPADITALCARAAEARAAPTFAPTPALIRPMPPGTRPGSDPP